MLTTFLNLPEGIQVRQMGYDAFVEENWASILSPEEHKRRDAFSHPGRQRGFTLGRVALRSLLAEHLNVAPNLVPLHLESSGQITCPESQLHLSLAHSGNQALATVAPVRIGIDLEEVRTKPDTLLEHILGEDEKDHIHSLPIPDSHRLFVCWTLKEAVLKAMGVGLRHAPRKVLLSIDTDSQSAKITDPDGEVWNARYVISDNWVSAVAF